MRALIGVSILALGLMTSSAAIAEDWFRLKMSAPIYFGGGGGTENPGGPTDPGGGTPGGGVNDDIAINVADSTAEREFGNLELDVFVSGVDGTYKITVENRPEGASFERHAEEYGRGQLVWNGAATGSYRPKVVVKDASDEVVVEREFDIVVLPPLDVSVGQAAYEVNVGSPLTIVPQVLNDIGTVTLSTTAPAWMGFNPSTGRFSVDVSSARDSGSVSVTGVDDFDMSNDTASFSVKVNAAAPDTTPNAFTIASLNNVEPRWPATSATVTPTGYDTPVTVSIGAGGEVQVGSGAWSSSATISPGQSFKVRTTSPDQSLTSTMPVTVGTAAPIQWSVSSWAETVRTISANASSPDLATLFGSSWTSTDRKRLIVGTGVTVSSTGSSVAALNVASSMQGTIILENRGIIAGAGGAGGSSTGSKGQDGGTAVALGKTGIKVINTGVIAGGGGGGGGGGKGADGTENVIVNDPETYRTSSPVTRWLNVVDVNPPTNSITWNGTNAGSPPNGLNVTSYSTGGCTYTRGAAQPSGAAFKYYAVSRSCSTTQSKTGGAGGAGGNGSAYPTSTKTTGASGTYATPAGRGGQGGDGAGFGAAGSTGYTGGTNSGGTAGSAGGAGGSAGYAISGSPTADSVLGVKHGR